MEREHISLYGFLASQQDNAGSGRRSPSLQGIAIPTWKDALAYRAGARHGFANNRRLPRGK